MRDEIIESLKLATEKEVAMIARTIRLPHDLDQEIIEFCDENKIRRSVIFRKIFEEGWKALKS